MGGKKKKNVANKLAKMSDEERARYMQHRAEVEEEAKRRKEQLIATFMKKKVKKEEAFSRLNLAKINQNWHQILRKTKCKEMKENVQHVKEWIDRAIAYKDRIIVQLITDLEEAEEDYLNNYNTHVNYLGDVMKKQFEYIQKSYGQYQKDVKALMISTKKDRENISNDAKEEENYLKTILYRQEIKENLAKKEIENCKQKYYLAEHEFNSKLQKMLKSREEECLCIWKQIEEQIAHYIQKTDARRMQYAELMKSDAESAAEIIDNEERIKQKEAEINNLKEQLEEFRSAQDLKITISNTANIDLKKELFAIRKNLQKDLDNDDKKMKLLVEVSSQTMRYLENIERRGKYLKNLVETCKKFETDREKMIKWMSVNSKNVKTEKDNLEEEEQQKVTEDVQDILALFRDSIKETDESETLGLKTEQLSELSPQSIALETPSPEVNNVTTVQNVTLQDKPSEETSSPILTLLTSEESQISEKSSSNFVDDCLKSLEPMECFWTTYNKVKVNCLELKEEKKILIQENKQLRGMIRAILEAAALGNSIPSSKVSTRVPSRKISACSAPIRRLDLVL